MTARPRPPRRWRRFLVTTVLATTTAATAWAGQAPSGTAGATPPPTAPSGTSVSQLPQGYTYNPEGRRDPFMSLLSRGSDQKSQTPRPAGLPGVSVGDVAIRGIVSNTSGNLALLEGPDRKTYIVRGGDRLFDATIKAVLADAVVFVQQVNDPLSLVKQREIRKPLRPTEEGK